MALLNQSPFLISLMLACWFVPGAINVSKASESELPDAVKIAMEQAEQRYFDGDYEDALRTLQSAQKWMDKSANRKLIQSLGGDHSVIRAYLMGLKAEIYAHYGDRNKALGALRAADSLSKPRRNYWTRLGNPPIILWQFEAFLKLIEGDVFRPIPDYGLTSEVYLPASLHGALAEKADPVKATLAYKHAESILSKPFVALNSDTTLTRLRGKLMVSLASTHIMKRGLPTEADVRDSRAYLARAEEFFVKNPVMELFLAADAPLPLTYKELEEKVKGNESLKTDLKRRFGQAIQDWLALKLAYLELEANGETSSREDPIGGLSATEKEFSRLYYFCHAQFPSTHPRLAEVLLSRARWYFYLASNSLPAVDESSMITALSLYRDCVFELTRLRVTHTLTLRETYEVGVLELAGLRGILALGERGVELSAAEQAGVRERIDYIENLLQALDAQHHGSDLERDDEAIGSPDHGAERK
jgi:tetratricopeptide (TPR) repeat protein